MSRSNTDGAIDDMGRQESFEPHRLPLDALEHRTVPEQLAGLWESIERGVL